MKRWKNAWELTKFEYRTIPPSYLQIFLLLGFGLFILVTTITDVEEQATLGAEWMLFLVVIVFPYLLRSEHIRGKNIGNREWASPQLVLTQTLPISHKTIATYRMVSYMVMIIVMNSLLFPLLYIISPYMRSIAPIGTYVIFIIMWICLAVALGGFQIHAEAGFYVVTYVFFLLFIMIPLAIVFAVVLFYKNYTMGMIQWMLDAAASYPSLTVVGSILLAWIGWVFHVHIITRKLTKTDY